MGGRGSADELGRNGRREDLDALAFGGDSFDDLIDVALEAQCSQRAFDLCHIAAEAALGCAIGALELGAHVSEHLYVVLS